MNMFGRKVTQYIPGEKQQWFFKFENGYEASVIIGPFTYGGPQGLYELAVLQDGGICYDTPITDDVIGYQTPEQIADLLNRIEKLPKKD